MRKREYQRRKERKVWRTWKMLCEMNVLNKGFDRECWDFQEHRKWNWLHLDKHGAVDIVASKPWVFCAQQDKLRPSEKKNHCCYVSLFLLDIYCLFFTRNEKQKVISNVVCTWHEQSCGSSGARRRKARRERRRSSSQFSRLSTYLIDHNDYGCR